jgi:hypothetical protein
MHPEIVRTMAEQQIDQWLAAAEADRQSRQARQGRARRSRRPRLLPARHRAAAEHPAPHGA